jgi:hypothetical protein
MQGMIFCSLQRDDIRKSCDEKVFKWWFSWQNIHIKNMLSKGE